MRRLAADWLGEIEYPWLRVDKGRMAEYPVETVAMMERIVLEAEKHMGGKLVINPL